jgi:hypothetical protein
VTAVTEPTGSAPYRHGIAELTAAGRPVRVLVDTAGTALCLSQALVDELGLDVHEWLDDQGTAVSVVEPPELRVGDAVLDTEGLVAYGFEDVRPLGLAARHADVLLPATVLRRHHVILDDPAGVMTVGPPASLERRGVAVPTMIDPDSGLILTSIEVDGEAFELVLDTAVTSSLAVDGLLRAWQGDHPDWPASVSAVGPGNMVGLPLEAKVPMLRVPLVQWGPFQVPEVAFTWRGDGDVLGEGALGGNVLKLFRLDLDWSAGSVRVEQGAPFAEHDAELVGVVLALGEEGWSVVATVSGLDDVRPGDLLIAVEGVETAERPLPEVLDLLRGTPGDRKHLTVDRDGERLDVDVPVLRLV